VDKDAIKLRAMDPSQISMVLFSMDKSEFTDYKVDSKTKVGINLERLSKILGRSRITDRVRIVSEPGKLNITFEGKKSKRTFTLPIIDVAPGPSKELKVDYTATVTMRGGLFKDVLKDALLVSPHLLLVADEDTFKAEANGDTGDFTLEYEEGEVELQVSRITSAVFSTEYLDDMTRGCDEDTKITIQMGAPTPSDSRPKPMRLEYHLGKATFTYYLAPRIESD